MNYPVTLLCRNPGTTPEKRMEQALMCAAIDGYTDATGELSRFITKLYREKDPLAATVHKALNPLIEQQTQHYSRLVAELNDEIPKGENHDGKMDNGAT